MQLHKMLFFAAISVGLLSGCSMFSGEEDVEKMSPVPQIENQFKATELWSASVGSGVGRFYSHLSPATNGTTVYAADRKGVVAALNINSGKSEWQINLSGKGSFLSPGEPAQLSGGITVADNKLFIGSERAQLYALSASDGSVLWQSRVSSEVLSYPVVGEGKVLVHTSNGMLQALDEESGKLLWTVNLDIPALSLRGESSPAIAYGAAIVGSNSGRVNAVLMKEGQIIWQQRVSAVKGGTEIDRLSDVNTTPVIIDNTVYALGYNGNLVAMDLRSGQVFWKREVGSMNDFLIDQDKIYLSDQNDRVVALSLEGGVSLWSQAELLHRKLTAPVIYKNYLVVGDHEGYLYWLDTETGRFVSKQKVDSSGFLSKPVVSDDKLIVQSRGGKVYTFRQ